jgi:hypothetical protein
MVDPNPRYFVVSHSNEMMSAVKILKCQSRLVETAKDALKEFNFNQNAWTMELTISNGTLRLESLQDGVPKPKEAMKTQTIRGREVPSTLMDDNYECIFDTKAAPNISHYLRLSSATSLGGGSGESVLKSAVKTFKQALRRCPAPLSFDPSNKLTVYVTRHGNSCNNITDNIFKKKSDPSLSDLGVSTLLEDTDSVVRGSGIKSLGLRPTFLSTLSELKPPKEPVYVTPSVRTWQTACLIYGQPLDLIVSPYIKEYGNNAGNLPERFERQSQKIKDWFERHFLEGNRNFRIFVANARDENLIQIYPEVVPFETTRVYEREHLTYYPDGIQKFCKWLTEHPLTPPQTGPAPQVELQATYSPFEHSDVSLGGRKRATRKRSSRKMKPYRKRSRR